MPFLREPIAKAVGSVARAYRRARGAAGADLCGCMERDESLQRRNIRHTWGWVMALRGHERRRATRCRVEFMEAGCEARKGRKMTEDETNVIAFAPRPQPAPVLAFCEVSLNEEDCSLTLSAHYDAGDIVTFEYGLTSQVTGDVSRRTAIGLGALARLIDQGVLNVHAAL